MRLGVLITTITSSLCLIACGPTGTKTDYQFGNTVPIPTSSMHNDWGNVQENTPMNVLAPMAENESIMPAEPVKVVQPKKLKPASTTLSITPTSIPRPEKTFETSTTVEQLAQPEPNNWQPNEALLIRGNELLGGLQKELGKKPSTQEMQKRLQTHMGLSAMQAQQVIAVLGL